MTPTTTPACIVPRWLFMIVACGVLTAAQVAQADEPSVVHAARVALARYESAPHATPTLSVLARLSAQLDGHKLTPAETGELRFLRAAVASDLLVLARVRGDATLLPRLEQALGVAPTTAFTHLDAELAACTQDNYRELSSALRAALSSVSLQESWPLARLRDVTGSQRDLLWVHAFAQAASREEALALLGGAGADPCGAAAACGAPYAAFDRRGRIAVRALAEVGEALRRLHSAAQSGDPLAAAAGKELAAMQASISAFELRPAPRSQHVESWLDAKGEPLTATPELLLWVSERSVRYAFVPWVRLGANSKIEVVSRQEPRLPNTDALRLRGTLRPFIHPVPELVQWLQAQRGPGKLAIAVASEPNAPALALGRALASLDRAGVSDVLVMGRTRSGEMVAQAVRLALQAPDAAETPAQVVLRVRLGGYSLRLPGGSPTLDIPRVRGEQGYHFDTKTLAEKLRGRRVSSSRVSFMSEVQTEQLTAALFEVGSTSAALELLLPQ